MCEIEIGDILEGSFWDEPVEVIVKKILVIKFALYLEELSHILLLIL